MTNSGLSLVDTSMVPFRGAHGLFVMTSILVVAGDTGFVSTLVEVLLDHI